MASQINATIPADNVKVAKADLRQNFLTAKNEITAIQAKLTLSRRIAFGLDSL